MAETEPAGPSSVDSDADSSSAEARTEDGFLAFCVWTVWSRISGWTIIGAIAGYLSFGLFLRAGTLERLGIAESRYILLFLAELALGALIFGFLGLQRGAWRAARGLALDRRLEGLATALFPEAGAEQGALERSSELFTEPGLTRLFAADGLSSPAAAAISVVAGAGGKTSRRVLTKLGEDANAERWSAEFSQQLLAHAVASRRRWTIGLTLFALPAFAALLGLFRAF